MNGGGFCLQLAVTVTVSATVILLLAGLCQGERTTCGSLEFYCPIEGQCVNFRISQFTLCAGSCPLLSAACDNNTKCYDETNRCDGARYCADGVDELHCSCGLLRSRCDDNGCYSTDKRCDGYRDCGDGSDEKDCHDNGCYSTANRCNGYRDCHDGSDEKDCHNSGCYSTSKRCDGKRDCQDGSDEKDCLAECALRLACDNGDCYDLSQWCDGYLDCSDGSDEHCSFSLTFTTPRSWSDPSTSAGFRPKRLLTLMASPLVLLLICIICWRKCRNKGKRNSNSGGQVMVLEPIACQSMSNSAQAGDVQTSSTGNHGAVGPNEPGSNVPLLPPNFVPPHLVQPSASTSDAVWVPMTTGYGVDSSNAPPAYDSSLQTPMTIGSGKESSNNPPSYYSVFPESKNNAKELT